MKADIEEKLKICEILKEIKIYQTKPSVMFIKKHYVHGSTVINYLFFPGKNKMYFFGILSSRDQNSRIRKDKC